jgi:hypothetical protein
MEPANAVPGVCFVFSFRGRNDNCLPCQNFFYLPGPLDPPVILSISLNRRLLPTPSLPHGVATAAGIRRRRSGPQRVRIRHPDVGGGRARSSRPRPAVLPGAPPQPVRACPLRPSRSSSPSASHIVVLLCRR